MRDITKPFTDKGLNNNNNIINKLSEMLVVSSPPVGIVGLISDCIIATIDTLVHSWNPSGGKPLRALMNPSSDVKRPTAYVDFGLVLGLVK